MTEGKERGLDKLLTLPLSGLAMRKKSFMLFRPAIRIRRGQRLQAPALESGCVLVWKKNQALSTAMLQFIEHAKEYLEGIRQDE